MKTIKQFFRLLYIQYVLAKNGLERLIVDIHLFAPFRFIIFFNPWNWFRKSASTRAVALRQSLEQLGPLFVKFGQALATRPDILPQDIAEELSKLHDSVPPFSSEQALAIIEATYGQSAFEVFAAFDPVPLASASIAQVHTATLKTGQSVVVKIVRPGMRSVIESDIGLLKILAKLAERYWKESSRFKPYEIVVEFERTLLDELNLTREASNGSQLRRNFADSSLLYIPEIYWDYVKPNVLVMERIHGIPVSNIAQLKAQGVNIKKLAENGVEIFFRQVFRDCFFHADMHPGNIFVSPIHLDNPQYMCVDFGIVGSINEMDQRYLAENLLAFFNRDYRRVAQLHIESGWVAPDSSVVEFESSIRMVCEPIFEKPIKEISFAHVVMHLFQVARQYHMEVQPQLVLLQKTLLAIEGLGRQLDPELDLWSTAKPFLEKWIREQIGPQALLKNLRANIPFFVEQLPHMPRLVYDVFAQMKIQQNVNIALSQSANERVLSKRKSWLSGLGLGVCFASMMVVGLIAFNGFNGQALMQLTAVSAIVGAVVVLIGAL
jgi:ubiquinone biosynthesis protein